MKKTFLKLTWKNYINSICIQVVSIGNKVLQVEGMMVKYKAEHICNTYMTRSWKKLIDISRI